MKRSPSIYAGGFWLGNMNVLSNFTAEYMRHVELLLDEGLANCDEQVSGWEHRMTLHWESHNAYYCNKFEGRIFAGVNGKSTKNTMQKSMCVCNPKSGENCEPF